MSRYDVAIVGYGPTAQLLALALGQQGKSVIVVERWKERYPLPRAVHIDHEIYRIIAANGLADSLPSLTQSGDYYEWFNKDWERLLVIDWSEEPVSGGKGANFINQPVLERALDEAVTHQPSVTLMLGWEALQIDQDETQARLRARHLESGEERSFEASFLVGCDGANSVVRQQIGASMRDLGFQEHWLVVDVFLKEGESVKSLGLPEIGQYCNPERPTTIVPGGIAGSKIMRRWEFMKLPGESIEELEDDEKVWELLRPWAGPHQVEIVRRATYNFRSLLAERWREGRIMLAGDAAHLTPPFMGQGMCSGIRDAWNLAWRLCLVLDGKADTSTLDAYQDERYPHVETLIEMAIFLGKIICVSDAAEAAKRDATLLSGDAPPFPEFPCLTRGLLFHTADDSIQPGAGLLAPHVTLESDGQERPMDAVYSPGFLLVVKEADGVALMPVGLMNAFSAIGGHVLTLGEDVREVEGRLSRFLSEQGWAAMLIRPDFYVYGGSSSCAGIAPLVEQLLVDLKV